MDGFPNQFVVDAEIEVDESVAHSGHLFPGNAGPFGSQIVGDLLDGLADDFQFSDDGAGGLVVGLERLPVHARR